MSMKDYIKDLTTYVTSTGFFDKIKVTAGKKDIVIEAMEREKEIILKGKFLSPLAELQGDFGLSNLNLLQTISSDNEFSMAESTVEIIYETRDNEKIPTELSYENRSKSYMRYRFMPKALVPVQPDYKEPKWDIVIKPTKANIQQFGWAANGLSTYEQYFIPVVKDNELRFFIGEDGGAAQRGGVVFATNITTPFSSGHKWKISLVQSLLKHAETTDCEMAFSTKGAIQITLNTGIAQWKYIIPAKIK